MSLKKYTWILWGIVLFIIHSIVYSLFFMDQAGQISSIIIVLPLIPFYLLYRFTHLSNKMYRILFLVLAVFLPVVFFLAIGILERI